MRSYMKRSSVLRLIRQAKNNYEGQTAEFSVVCLFMILSLAMAYDVVFSARCIFIGLKTD